MTRRILMIAHPLRPEAQALASQVATKLALSGIETVTAPEQGHVRDLTKPAPPIDPHLLDGCELVFVLGGDGTILRGAELARGHEVPVLGVNLGHVGFLAEADREDLRATLDHIVDRRYTVQRRMALDVAAMIGDDVIAESWALNEVSVEKTARERMLELTIEIEGRPLSTWGCDGVVVATPTGSTAYAFSAGGPVVWPDVEAILLVPNSAHALFSRPIVVGPDSHVAVEVIAHYEGHGIVWCDGRRHVDLPAGARIEVRRSATPVLLARLDDEPFTDRLVEKFGLSIHGWRGAARHG